jgi:hypothetical protein
VYLLQQVRNPGEPGSQPFAAYTATTDSFRSPQPALADTAKREVTAADLQSAASAETFTVDSDGKIRPVVRTRFRSRATPVINTNRQTRPRKKKTGKIVLKRRKVKKLRSRPRLRPSSDRLNNEVEEPVGSAPEANRGRPLAELAFATLSREEQFEEANTVFNPPR